jgi:hypothetical protein
MRAGRELLVQAFSILEPRVVTGARQRRRRRYLITRFGEIRFSRLLADPHRSRLRLPAG